MSELTIKQHIAKAIELTKEAKQLENHIAYLRGDAFGLRLQVTKLQERAIWHLDYADALRQNQSQFMWRLI